MIPEDDREFIEMWNRGVPVAEMQEHFGMSRASITYRREAYGLAPRVRKSKEPKPRAKVVAPRRQMASPEQIEKVLGAEVGETACGNCGTRWIDGTLLDQSRRFKEHECVTTAAV